MTSTVRHPTWKPKHRTIAGWRPAVITRLVKRRDSDFVDSVMAETKRTFDNFKPTAHRPSREQWDGLEQIPITIQAMADRHGGGSRFFDLSSLHPGIGKTTIVSAAVRQLHARPEYSDKGVIIFLPRIEFFPKYIEAMGDIDPADYAVIVSPPSRKKLLDQGVNLGNENPDAARVLFTTQAQLQKRCSHFCLFGRVDQFLYKGRPRPVRIWDESILLSATYTLSQNTITDMLSTLQRHDPVVHAVVDAFYDKLKVAKTGDKLEVPDLEELGITANVMQEWFTKERDKEAVNALFHLGGRVCRVRRDASNAVLDYDKIIPNDLAPMLILDASGEVRTTYRHWYEYQRNLRYLHSPSKNYRPYTVHHWDHAAGRGVFNPENPEEWQVILDAVAAEIATFPEGSKVLVIHFQPSDHIIDIPKELTKRLPDGADVRFLHWGVANATNEFGDRPYVFFLGVGQPPPSQVEALARSVQMLDTDDSIAEESLDDIRIGEAKNVMLQAACRGNVRMSDGDSCPPGNHLYAVYSSDGSMPLRGELLTEIFPGAAFAKWRPAGVPIKVALRTKAARLADMIAGRMDGQQSITIAKADILAETGSRPGNLARLLTGRELGRWLDKVGLTLESGRREVFVHSKSILRI